MDTETALEYAVVARKVGAQCRAIAVVREKFAESQRTLEQVVKGPPFGEEIEDTFLQVEEMDLDLPPEAKRERALEMALAPFRETSRARLLDLLDAAETEGQEVALRWLIGELGHVEDIAPEELETATKAG